jgi:DUF4097 and DUF4098 domain-containing protein YvlB
MKLKSSNLFLCVALGAAGIASAEDINDHSSTTHTLHFAPGAPHTLEVRTITGNITVEAYDGSDVEMIVNKSITADGADDLRDANREVVLNITDNAATVSAIARYQDESSCGEKGPKGEHWHWHEQHYDVRYDFTIRVPRDTRLELCTVNDGNISVTGTRGDFEIQGINGRITMTDVAGAGEAKTINGRVTASFVSAPNARSSFKTVNGDVVVSLPDQLATDLRMKTFNGGLYTDFEVQPLPAAKPVAVEKRDGMSVYKTNGFTSMRVGNGGPELTMDTLNGDVRVLRRAR